MVKKHGDKVDFWGQTIEYANDSSFERARQTEALKLMTPKSARLNDF